MISQIFPTKDLSVQHVLRQVETLLSYRDGEGRGSAFNARNWFLGQLVGVRIPTMAPVSGAASSKSLNTVEPHFVF